MSLIEATDMAKKESKADKKKARYYVVTDATGEADVSTIIKKGETAHSAFVAGKKEELTEAELTGATAVTSLTENKKKPAKKEQVEETKNQKTEIMATAKKAGSASKSTKKSAPAKPAAKNAVKSTTTKSAVKPTAAKSAAKKSAQVKKAAGETQHPIFRPIVGGACLNILNAIKKGVHSKEELAKIAKTKEANIAWYISKIRNNGHKVEITDKGYKISK